MAPLVLVVGDDESMKLAVARCRPDGRSVIRTSTARAAVARIADRQICAALERTPDGLRPAVGSVLQKTSDSDIAPLAQRVFHETAIRVLVKLQQQPS